MYTMDMADRETTLHTALRRAYRVATRDYRARLAHLGLTGRQAAVILAVEACPGMGLTALAESVIADQPTISALVDRLVERGLFRRVTDEVDRRRTCLSLTPAAAAVADDIRNERAAMEVRLVDILGTIRANALLDALNDLTERLGQADRGLPD
ncbi:MAG: MarR family winged helix-turn-helix transcriptional regulator [Dehalococcoidia bacterium]|nr:MarR family winged helix-turn-helix transcriptional regulator [Dehalococcoidia bacterium]